MDLDDACEQRDAFGAAPISDYISDFSLYLIVFRARLVNLTRP